MPDINDVVRHVILRILVDQSGLGGEMAAARAKLKELENDEKKSNAARAKDAEKVTDAFAKQNSALEDNRKAHEAAARSAQGSADKVATQHKAATEAIKAETKAIEEQTLTEARAERERSKTRNERLEADAKRKKINQDTVNAQTRDEAKLAELTSKTDTDRLNRDAARRRYNQETKNLQEQATIALGNLERREEDKTQAQIVENTQTRLRKAAELRRFNAESRAKDAAAAEKQSNTELTNAQKLKQALLDARAERARAMRESQAAQGRKDYTTESSALRSDRVADRSQNRQDANAANKRRLDSQKQIADLEAKKLASDQKVKSAQEKSDEDLHGKVMANLAKELTAAERLVELRSRNADARTRRDALRPDDIATSLSRNSSARSVAGSNENVAANRELASAARAADAENAQSENAAARRARAVRDEATTRARIAEIAARTAVSDQRSLDVAERRARALEREAERRVRIDAKPRTIREAFSNLGNTSRRLLAAGSDGIDGEGESRTRRGLRAFDNELSTGGTLTSSVTKFFGHFKKEAESSVGFIDRMRYRLHLVGEEVKRIPASGGGGGFSGFIRVIGNEFGGIADSITAKAKSLSRTLFSFRGLILIVLAAFGPLAAIVGAAGAGILGLASDLVALSGSLLALPGLIGALVGGIGALAIVLKPVSGAFTAFAAAQKASADAAGKNATAQRDASRALVDAKRAEQDAQTELTRAQQDAPEAERRLADARRQATRDIQDYRLALQKLKFDQEGAELGVESAEQQYRRALADPSANNLDRKVARHNVQGALFDQRDQKVSQGRLEEDANLAQQRGVEGAPAVVDARRGIEDATRRLQDATLKATRATEDLNEAQKDSDAGGKTQRQAQDALKAALDKLPPSTRTVVKSLLDLNGEYKKMRDRLSEKIFGPLAGDTGKFGTALDELESFLGPAADALGNLAHQAITLLTNKEWKAFFSAQGKENGKIISGLGDALLDAADGFRSVIEVARPFTEFVVGGIKSYAGAFKDFATSKTGRDSIRDFLEITQKRMKELAPIITGFATGLGGFFKALNTGDGGKEDFTTKINKGILGLATNFAKLGTDAAKPGSGFRKFLDDVGPLLKDVVHFLGVAAASVGDLFKDPDNIKEARNILATLSDKILPELVKFFDKLSTSGAVSSILKGVGSLIAGINEFLDQGGSTALGFFADILQTIGTTVEFLTTKFPFLTKVLADLSVVIGAIAGAALFAKLTGILKLITGISGGLRMFKTGGLSGIFDAGKDKLFGSDKGVNAAKRDSRSSGLPIDKTGTGGVIPHLSRMEVLLQNILATLRGGGGRGTSSGNGGNGPIGDDDDGRGRKRPNGPQSGGGGSTGGGGPGVDDDEDGRRSRRPRRRSGTIRPKRRYSLPIFGAVDETEEIINRVRGNPPVSATRRERTVPRTTINDPSPIPGGVGTPQRGNSMFRSDRIERNRQRAADRAQAPLDEEDAYVDNRRFDADANRNNRPSRSTVSSSRRRRTQAQERYNTRNARLTTPTPRPDLPDLDDDDDAPSPRRTRSTTPASPQASYDIASSSLDDTLERISTPAPARPERFSRLRNIGRRLRSTMDSEDSGDIAPPLRSAGRRFRSTMDSDAGGSINIPARETDGPLRRLGRRFRSTMDSDAGGSINVPARSTDGPLRRLGRRIRDTNREIWNSDEGSVQLGPSRAADTDEDNPRRRRSTRGPARVSRRGRPRRGLPRRRGRGRGRGLPTAVGGAAAGASYEDGYDDGYDDAEGDGGGFDQGGLPDIDLPDRDEEPRKSRAERRAERRAARRGGAGEREGGGRRRGGLGSRGRGGRAGGLRNLFSRGGGRAAGGLGRAAGGFGRFAGGLGRVGGGLARGLAGGIGGVAASLALSFGGDAAINKFVKDDDDANSLSRGLGAVSTGAGIGATIGSIVPGVGTVIGGAVGGAIGGAYSLVKDKNLRNFVGGKISSGAKAVGGFFSKAGSAVKNFFGGGDDDDKPAGDGPKPGIKGALVGAALGPVGAVLGGTKLGAKALDLGGDVVDSLKKGGKGVGDFFTKTIPGSFHKGTKGIHDFFTKTLPGLPGKAFDAFFFGIGKIQGFFTKTLPRAVGRFFTETIPSIGEKIGKFFTEDIPRFAGKAWTFVVTNLWDPFVNFIKGIPKFFTETIPKWFKDASHWLGEHVTKPVISFVTVDIPKFFTETIPKWFKEAPKWLNEHVSKPVTEFFTVKIPEFFTKTLPDTISKLPGVLYDNLVQPVLDFFGGLAGHVGDFLKGGWSWAKGLFSRAGDQVKAGNESVKMSGGVIEGVYQGIEDNTRLRATVGEFVVRRSKVQQPRGAEFLRDYNEGRFNPADWYQGLSAASAPAVMSVVPPTAPVLVGVGGMVTNNTSSSNSGMSIGDIVIHNPVREPAAHSLRRQIEIARMRHRL
jgi:hypothetical protein